MKLFSRNIVFFTFALLLSACGTTLKTQQVTTEEMATEVAKQKEISLLDKYQLAHHVQNIGFQILTASVPMCGARVRSSLGVTYWSKDSFPADFRDAAQTAFGVGEAVQLARVAPNSPAAIAGLRVDDVLIKAGTHKVGTGKDGVAALTTYLDKNLTDAPMDIVYARGDNVQTATLTPKTACDYPVLYDDDAAVNAYADGQRIVMQRGIIEFVRNDDELAMIVGHELAHNVLNHISKKQAQITAGMLGGLLLDVLVGTGGQFSDLGGQIGAQAYSPAYESEADYMGLYATARAGYNIQKAPFLWRRMGARNTRSIEMTSTHPPTAERFVVLEKTVTEIEAKIASGSPLIPDQKQGGE